MTFKPDTQDSDRRRQDRNQAWTSVSHPSSMGARSATSDTFRGEPDAITIEGIVGEDGGIGEVDAGLLEGRTVGFMSPLVGVGIRKFDGTNVAICNGACDGVNDGTSLVAAKLGHTSWNGGQNSVTGSAVPPGSAMASPSDVHLSHSPR
jgi:hypothetical protein